MKEELVPTDRPRFDDGKAWRKHLVKREECGKVKYLLQDGTNASRFRNIGDADEEAADMDKILYLNRVRIKNYPGKSREETQNAIDELLDIRRELAFVREKFRELAEQFPDLCFDNVAEYNRICKETENEHK